MSLLAFAQWRTFGLGELERIHADMRDVAPRRRWGAEPLNRSLFVALIAQFQTHCRDLHDQAIEVHAVHGKAEQRELMKWLMSQGRQLDTQTPRTSVLAHDFTRLGFNMVDELKAAGATPETAMRLLEVAVDFRNAIVHGNETQVAGSPLRARSRRP